MKNNLKQKIIALAVLVVSSIFYTETTYAQTGNHVYSPSESVAFSNIDLSTPGGQTWSTDRATNPGYFTAVGSAIFTGAADANANVDGYVKYHAYNSPASSFTFPVGTGSDLRELTISGTIPNDGEYATAWILGDPSLATDPTFPNPGGHNISSVGTGIESVSPVGQWDWQDLSGDAAGLTVTVSIPDMTGFADASDLRLVGWNGTEWVDLSGTPTASGNTEDQTLSGTMIAGITAIGIGKAIPITTDLNLISFKGGVVECTASLEWVIYSSDEYSTITLEKKIASGAFEDIKTINVKPDNSDQTFTYTDADLLSNMEAYYRLRLEDASNNVSYSDVLFLKGECAGDIDISVYPNPTRGQFFIKGLVDYENIELRVYNSVSQIVKLQKLEAPSGVLYETIDMSGSQTGAYIILLLDENNPSQILHQESVIIQ